MTPGEPRRSYEDGLIRWTGLGNSPSTSSDNTARWRRRTERRREGGRNQLTRFSEPEATCSRARQSGQEDIIVTEMLEELPVESIQEITTFVRRRSRGECDSPPWWEDLCSGCSFRNHTRQSKRVLEATEPSRSWRRRRCRG